MAKKAPTPVRFDMMVADRLSAFVSVNHGLSLSAAANMLVDEGLRMIEHPGHLPGPGPPAVAPDWRRHRRLGDHRGR